jgi:hypothetical protein
MMPPRERLDPDMLDADDPFELDQGNRPHLCKHGFTEEDLYDVWLGERIFFPAQANGEADVLLVAEVPGGDVLCVPLAPPRSEDYRKCRPIGLYRPKMDLVNDYRDARAQLYG